MSGAVSPNSPGRCNGLCVGSKDFFSRLVLHHVQGPEMKRWFHRQVSLFPSLPACVLRYVGCVLETREEMKPSKAVADNCI